MKFLGNIAWLILGGLVIALIYYAVGLLMCINTLVNKPNEPGFVSVAIRKGNPQTLISSNIDYEKVHC